MWAAGAGPRLGADSEPKGPHIRQRGGGGAKVRSCGDAILFRIFNGIRQLSCTVSLPGSIVMLLSSLPIEC